MNDLLTVSRNVPPGGYAFVVAILVVLLYCSCVEEVKGELEVL